MTTISNNKTAGIDLNSGSYSSPLSIAAGVSVTNSSPDALYGSTAFFAIENYGTISGTGSGVYLAPGGSVTNAASASITGGSFAGVFIYNGAGTVSNAGVITSVADKGVLLNNGGTVSNLAGGTISGADRSVYIQGGAGTVTNAGLMAGGEYGAVSLEDGGRITNTGTVMEGVAILNAAGMITNAGEIEGSEVGNPGAFLDGGGTITNQAGGTIGGQYAGVALGLPGQTNGGGGALTNQADGTISGDDGVFAGGGSGTVTNAGTIIGTFAGTIVSSLFGTLVLGAGVSMSAGGTVTNQPGGTIAGISSGVYLSTAAGTVANAGSVAGTGTAGRGIVLAAGGTVSNATGGTITGAGGNAVYVTGTAGTVANLGVVMATGGTHSAIGLLHGGYVSNAGTGTISGAISGGVYVTGAAGTLVNAGQITGNGTHSGVTMERGGSATNQSGGTITGNSLHSAIYIGGSAGTVVNDGRLVSNVNFTVGGTVTNRAGGTISDAGGPGVVIAGAAGTVLNAGAITNAQANRAAIGLESGGYIGNQSGGSIISTLQIGVFITGGSGTLINDGRIAGNVSYPGVYLQSGGAVTNAATASITGGGVGVGMGSGPTTVVNAGTVVAANSGGTGIVFRAAGTLTNAAAASITGGSTGVYLASGGAVVNAGTIVGNGGTAVAFGGTGSSLLLLNPGYRFSGRVVGSPTGANTLELASAASVGAVTGLGTGFTNFGTIAFDNGAQWSISGNTAALAGGQTISGFTNGDTIDLAGVSETIAGFGSGTLSLVGSAALNLVLPGSFATPQFQATPSSDGTAITVACFAAATRLLTVSGEVAVAALAPGDLLMTRSGQLLPVRWIGHRHVDCTRHPNPEDVWPVRVRTGAFAAGIPHRDLLLSPDHAVFIDGALIPIRYLINGRTIGQERVDEVTYYHVELSSHGVILAEGLPCESYLDTGNRGAFANGASPVMLHPDFARTIWATQACAELVLDGPKLAAARKKVLAQAEALGHRLSSDPGLDVIVDGRTVRPEIAGKTWCVRLPPAARSIRLVSRAWVPAHTRANETDTRSLGVAIANLRLDGRTIPLDDPRMSSGWLAPEQADGEAAAAEWRWTDGDAGLALAGVRDLTFDLVMTGTYWEATVDTVAVCKRF